MNTYSSACHSSQCASHPSPDHRIIATAAFNIAIVIVAREMKKFCQIHQQHCRLLGWQATCIAAIYYIQLWRKWLMVAIMIFFGILNYNLKDFMVRHELQCGLFVCWLILCAWVRHTIFAQGVHTARRLFRILYASEWCGFV